MSFETVQAYFERFGMADRCMDLKAVSYTHLTLPTIA